MRDAKNYTVIGVCILILLMILSSGYKLMFSIPDNFPTGKTFIVNENESLKSIAERLKEEHIISSSVLFRAGISFLEKDTAVQVGGYTFKTQLSLFEVITLFVEGHPSSPLLSVTIPEGQTSSEIASIVAKVLPKVSPDIFTQVAENYNANGKLFPSTYFLLPSYTAEDIVKIMLNTFAKKIATAGLFTKINPPLTSEHDVLVLASILEGEAKTQQDMKIIAGILLERLSRGMPLQVDVSMETYKQKGLPKNPINNPGLTAIDAVLHPAKTEYLFYITGNDGQMYYAKTFDEHRKNIKTHLK